MQPVARPPVYLKPRPVCHELMTSRQSVLPHSPMSRLQRYRARNGHSQLATSLTHSTTITRSTHVLPTSCTTPPAACISCRITTAHRDCVAVPAVQRLPTRQAAAHTLAFRSASPAQPKEKQSRTAARTEPAVSSSARYSHSCAVLSARPGHGAWEHGCAQPGTQQTATTTTHAAAFGLGTLTPRLPPQSACTPPCALPASAPAGSPHSSTAPPGTRRTA